MTAALEYAATLQTCSPGLPVILAAPSTREWNAPALAEAGIAEIIHQPLSSVELAGALARCMASVDTAARSRVAMPKLNDVRHTEEHSNTELLRS
jgi:BarA-like signal transduction histidine kinase